MGVVLRVRALTTTRWLQLLTYPAERAGFSESLPAAGSRLQQSIVPQRLSSLRYLAPSYLICPGWQEAALQYRYKPLVNPAGSFSQIRGVVAPIDASAPSKAKLLGNVACQERADPMDTGGGPSGYMGQMRTRQVITSVRYSWWSAIEPAMAIETLGRELLRGIADSPPRGLGPSFSWGCFGVLRKWA